MDLHAMTTIVWRFTDGKAGHDSQSQGLLGALRERAAVLSHDIAVERKGSGLWSWLSGSYPHGARYAPPDLLIGAGHATHWHLLAARRRWGGRAIVLMKPSLPLSWFDLCLVTEHDGPVRGVNVLPTLGALNSVEPCRDRDLNTGLIVLGGPSRHYRWNDDQILSQIDRLIEERPLNSWLVTTSRRTPETILGSLTDKPGLCCLPYASSGGDWLSARLAEAGQVWVSEDSVSMIYEALTAGARLGLLRVERRRTNRVTSGVDALVDRGWVGQPGHWQLAAGPDQPINEAARCADWIKHQWLVNH
jgi:mitochondrial fission protein ELM1